MMISKQGLVWVIFALGVSAGWAEPKKRQPHIGYLYPAGGPQGTTFIILAGGQNLRGASDVHISGQGVKVSIVQHCPPMFNLKKEEREAIQQRFKEVRTRRISELTGRNIAPPKADQNDSAAEPVEIPRHPLLYDLDNKSLRELMHITTVLFSSRDKQQQNRQIAESLLIEITIDPNTPPGNYEVRVKTPMGLSNPMVFQIGKLPEIRELEPNNDNTATLPALAEFPRLAEKLKDNPLELPVLVNGQILPGDVDRFRFRARQGQQLVIQAQARSLIPYLADAVPGWFQSTLTLYDTSGGIAAFNDDYQFSPDPVIFYHVDKTGQYELEIRDSIYRGREDFVYRISIGELPFVTSIFPLGGKAGVKTLADISGWNLPANQLALDTTTSSESFHQTTLPDGNVPSNSIIYAVGTLPECNESESNNTVSTAQTIDLPKIINGRIGNSGDLDIFRIKGKAGQDVIAEVYARRLNSPLDSVVKLMDESGAVVAWNDDFMVQEKDYLYKDALGTMTHHADSYLSAKLPKDGIYYVQLSDSQQQSGQAYAYRLRISAPQPDFELRVTPSSVVILPGSNVPICVYAIRKDGFNGEIEVSLKNAPAGFKLTGGRIPADSSRIRMTLTSAGRSSDEPVALRFEGSAQIAGQTVYRLAAPAEDAMQAFLYRHLVPSQLFLAATPKAKWAVPPVQIAGRLPLRLVPGQTTTAWIKTGRRPMFQNIQWELDNPPQGITLQKTTVMPEGIQLQIKADSNSLPAGLKDNLIIEMKTQRPAMQKDGKKTDTKQIVSMGFLPAIPIEVIKPE